MSPDLPPVGKVRDDYVGLVPRVVDGRVAQLDAPTCSRDRVAAARALKVVKPCPVSAVTRATPSADGNRRTALARPLESVTPEEDSIFAPGDAVKVTAHPGTGLPESSFSTAASGVGSRAPGTPVWLFPPPAVN